MKQIPILLIKAYQQTIGPVLPVVLGAGCGCRFTPSCSHYAIEALQTHGLVAGSFLATKRVLRCNPFSSGGFDPVPAVGSDAGLAQAGGLGATRPTSTF